MWQWSDNPSDGRARRHELEYPSDPWMFYGTPKGIWRLLDAAVGETVPIMTALEYANIMRGRAPHDMARDELVIERVVAVARYLHLQCQSLFEALRDEQCASTILHNELERVRAASRQELASPPSEEVEQLQEDLIELREDLLQISQDLEAERSNSSRLEKVFAMAQRHASGLESDLSHARNRYSDACRDASSSRLEVERINNSLLQVTSQRDSLLQQLELTRDSLSTEQRECSRLRDELAAAGIAAQVAEKEHDRLLAQSLRDSEVAPHLPAAVVDELAHLRQEITETLGEQALTRLLSRPRRGALTGHISEGRVFDYSSAMTAAYDPRVSTNTSSPVASVTDTPIHPMRAEGRRPTGMESPVSTTRAATIAPTPFSVRRVGAGTVAFVEAHASAADPTGPMASNSASAPFTAIANVLLNTRPVELKGSELTSAQVRKFIDYVEACVRAGAYNATTIANLIDPPAMEAIDTLMHTSDMMRDHPVDQWQTQWDLERILDALREIYPLNESERFVNKEERWEAALKSLKDVAAR